MNGYAHMNVTGVEATIETKVYINNRFNSTFLFTGKGSAVGELYVKNNLKGSLDCFVKNERATFDAFGMHLTNGAVNAVFAGMNRFFGKQIRNAVSQMVTDTMKMQIPLIARPIFNNMVHIQGLAGELKYHFTSEVIGDPKFIKDGFLVKVHLNGQVTDNKEES